MNTPDLNSFTNPKPKLNTFSFFANLRIGIKLFILIAISVVGLGIFATFAFYTMGTVQINSPLYQQLAQNQELVADILPPPAYIIESYLTTSLLLDAANNADTASVNNLIQKISVLQNEYETRHTYWTEALVAGGSENTDLKQALLIDSYLPAQKFYEVVNNQLIPAIRAGRLDEANKIFHETLTPAYESHRSAIDRVVQLQRVQIQDKEIATQSLINRSAIFLITLIIITALITISLGILIVRAVVTPVSQLALTANQIAGGNLEVYALADTTDEIGMLARAFNSMIAQLKDSLRGLEQRVAERTTELEHRSKELADRTVQLELSNVRTQKRATQLQAISDVSRTIAAVRKVTDILPRITKVVSEQFGFYHVGIFLLDEANQYAILAAANSEGAQRMLSRGHRLKVGAQGIVGYVTDTGNPRIALDTGADAVFFNNPDLPNTHSEMAVPLKSGGKIIGALDVQSEQANAFTQEDADVIQTLADQVSIAIENARLFDATQKSLSESETVYRQYVQREWKRLTSTQKILGFRYTVAGATPIENLITSTDIKKAAETGETLAGTDEASGQGSLAVPIKLRDEVIGVLNIRTPGKRAWRRDEIGLVQAVAERVAVSAENARLFDETTNRAERERTVSEITSKIRSTNDPNEMIRIAINELKQALQIKDVHIVPYNPPKNNGES